jgi:HAD superfamily hydrolase (TIGR01509 family)
MMLHKVGLHNFFEGRIFSGHEMPRSKPFPDVYLAAASHLQVDPARCLVVEDTSVGITAGVAAGSTVWAYAPPSAPTDVLVQAGAAHVFAHMHELRI